MNTKVVLFIRGIGNDGRVKFNNDKIQISGCAALFEFIESMHFKKELLVLDASDKTKLEINTPPDLIINEISEADTHTHALFKAAQLIQIINVPVINAPINILKTGRDATYKLLQHIDGLIIPKTISLSPKHPREIHQAIKKNNFSYPFILREAGAHNGEKLTLINSEKDLTTLHAFALDARKYYCTEFIDYRNKDNLFIKYRLALIDNDIFIVHAFHSWEWMVHARNRIAKYNGAETAILESFDQVIKPKIINMILEIKNILGLEYFGIDCAIDENFNLIIFEINTTMTMLELFNNHADIYVEKATSAFTAFIEKKIGI